MMDLDSDDDPDVEESDWIESWMEDEGLDSDDDDIIPDNIQDSGVLVDVGLDSDDDEQVPQAEPEPEPEPEPEVESVLDHHCQECNKTYKSQRSLKRHLDTDKVHVKQRASSKRHCSNTEPPVPIINVER